MSDGQTGKQTKQVGRALGEMSGVCVCCSEPHSRQEKVRRTVFTVVTGLWEGLRSSSPDEGRS